MKRSLLLVIFALLAVTIASNTTYEQQTLIPTLEKLLPNRPFEGFLSHFEITYWGRIISIENSGYYYFLEFAIRKATHFCGYGAICLIIYYFYRSIKWRFAAPLAILSIVAIASIDEFRQSFLDGRTGTYKDVLIDTSGAILFMLIVFIIKRFAQRRK